MGKDTDYSLSTPNQGVSKNNFDTEIGHTDKNDVNEMAPTIAILETKLGIVDGNGPNMEIDINIEENTPSSNGRAKKRARNYRDEPTRSDLTRLKSIIQPEEEDNIPSRPVTRSLSRKRTISDLVHSSSNCPPINLDEPEATAIYGEPVDSSSSSLMLDTTEESRPVPRSLSVKYPGSSQAGSDNPLCHKTPSELKHKNEILSDGTMQHTTSLETSSSLFMPSHHGLKQRRNSCANKKGLQRPVRIQLLDEAESQRIRQEDQHTSSSTLSSSGSKDISVDENQDTDADSEDIRDDDQNIVLPIEDPAVHDWDVEELDDEESIGISKKSTSKVSKSLSRGGTKNNISNSLGARITPSRDNDNDNEGEEGNDEEWNPQLDPEREVSSMSEDQELDLHNVHMRLETQRGFQDCSSLDLGELDGFVTSEDGRYGGALEADDEGEDFWENR